MSKYRPSGGSVGEGGCRNAYPHQPKNFLIVKPCTVYVM